MKTNNYTDTQLKQALAKMLPNTLIWDDETTQHNTERPQEEGWGLCWDSGNPVLDTELLHFCWLVEESLDLQGDLNDPPELREPECVQYYNYLFEQQDGSAWQLTHATWRQRVIALAKVKGVEIV